MNFKLENFFQIKIRWDAMHCSLLVIGGIVTSQKVDLLIWSNEKQNIYNCNDL